MAYPPFTFDLTFGILATELDDVVTLSEAEKLAEGVPPGNQDHATTWRREAGAGGAPWPQKKKKDVRRSEREESRRRDGPAATSIPKRLRKILQQPVGLPCSSTAGREVPYFRR